MPNRKAVNLLPVSNETTCNTKETKNKQSIKLGYFITVLKLKFLVSQLASKKIPTCIAINFVQMLAPTETFLRLLVAVNYFKTRGATSIYFSLNTYESQKYLYAWVVLPRYRWCALHW